MSRVSGHRDRPTFPVLSLRPLSATWHQVARRFTRVLRSYGYGHEAANQVQAAAGTAARLVRLHDAIDRHRRIADRANPTLQCQVLRLRRVVCAIAVFVITAIFGGNIVTSHAAQIVPMAKINVTAAFKSIVIRDAAPYVEPCLVPRGTTSRFIELFFGSRFYSALSGPDLCANNNVAQERQFCGVEISFVGISTKFPLDCPLQIMSGQTSCVVDDNVASNSVIIKLCQIPQILSFLQVQR